MGQGRTTGNDKGSAGVCSVICPRKPVQVVALAALAASVVAVREPDAMAQAIERIKDQPSHGQGQEQVPQGDKDPLRGSTFLMDQSMTTSTAGVGFVTPQSYVPVYEWWLSLRPRWNFNDHLRVQARLDYYKELTNSSQTTNYREDNFGDIWTDLVYSTPLATEGPWKDTKVSVGARALWPTSKASQGAGNYVTLGATGGVSQRLTLRGPDAPALNSARLGLSFTYLHPFSDSTTPNNGGFGYTRMDTDEHSFVSHQLSGQPLTEHTLYGVLDTGLDITPKLSATLDFILVNQWHYAPSEASPSQCPVVMGQPACAPRVNDQRYIQLSWLLLSVDYEIIPELSLGLGYYNLANTVAPDGTVRTLFSGGDHSLLWSPDARVFLDVTANLDHIFEDITGRYKSKPGETNGAARTARQQRVLNELR
jgi:hypothetical protein